LVEARAPLAYLDTETQSVELRTNIPLSVIPDSLLNMLPITPDSIRAVVATERTDTIDAAGTLTLNDQTREVLRQVRTQSTAFRVEAKFSIFPWADVTKIVLALAGIDPPAPDTTRSYRFLADGDAFPIAEVFVDSAGNASRVESSESLTVSATREIARLANSLRVFPNPAVGTVTIALEHPQVIGHIEAFVADGGMLPVGWSMTGDQTISVRLPDTFTGNAVLVLRAPQGGVIGTARLQVVR
ncbi:MAG: hypothetical protein R3330_02460, partial [Saprospiraceae bacterium]|nr:hypothetical protein [Saprospiraceae bacterium]